MADARVSFMAVEGTRASSPSSAWTLVACVACVACLAACGRSDLLSDGEGEVFPGHDAATGAAQEPGGDPPTTSSGGAAARDASPDAPSTKGSGRDAASEGATDPSSDDGGGPFFPGNEDDGAMNAPDEGACGPATCAGCCMDGVCQPGVSTAACGTQGTVCQLCDAERACTPQGVCE